MFWGAPAPPSCLEQGSAFHDAVLRDPTFNADVIVAN
jgi:hypothetical protein